MKFYLVSGIILVICNVKVLVLCDNECVRPEDLKLKEDRCWTAQVDLVDRAKETSRNVLNFAKKKLGLETDPNEPKKCEYYMCIFQEMHAINGNGYPLYEKIKEWTENHVVYNTALKLMDQLDRCQESLTNSTVSEKYFNGDLVQPTDSAEQQPPPEKAQSKCEIIAEYMKCLSHQAECSIFHFP